MVKQFHKNSHFSRDGKRPLFGSQFGLPEFRFVVVKSRSFSIDSSSGPSAVLDEQPLWGILLKNLGVRNLSVSPEVQ